MRAARLIGRAGETMNVTPARCCAWCPTPHWMSRADALRNALGAPTTHGMCDRAAERFAADVESLGNGEGT